MIQSPLNYTGGKYRLLPQILPQFPQKIHTFVDLFCGGCNVGINIKAERVLYNDLNSRLISLFTTFKNMDQREILQGIYEIIEKYDLSLVRKNGYAFYDCESSSGVGKYNKDRFLKLRADFNGQKSQGSMEDLMFYVLIVYAFNNQIRFNRSGEFNLPVGKRDFNQNMERKLCTFVEALQNQNCSFTCRNFSDMDVSFLKEGDFVYADPPYLITCATYNEQGGWDAEKERALLDFLDQLHRRKIKFALSNVVRSRGKENSLLLDWLCTNRDLYRVIPLNYSYSNSNYHIKDRDAVSEEVLIVNY